MIQAPVYENVFEAIQVLIVILEELVKTRDTSVNWVWVSCLELFFGHEFISISSRSNFRGRNQHFIWALTSNFVTLQQSSTD